MAKYLVTPEMYPGTYRADEGFFHVGQVFELPDEDPPPRKAKPADKAAQAAFKKHFKLDLPLASEPEGSRDEKPKTLREAAREMGIDS